MRVLLWMSVSPVTERVDCVALTTGIEFRL